MLACNRDDHVRNFAYLMDERGEWKMSPAYNLTLSQGPGGYHTTSVMGEALRTTRKHLLALARSASLTGAAAEKALTEVEAAVDDFRRVAKTVGVGAATVKLVQARLEEIRRDWAP